MLSLVKVRPKEKITWNFSVGLIEPPKLNPVSDLELLVSAE
jgi:hypothetical protein